MLFGVWSLLMAGVAALNHQAAALEARNLALRRLEGDLGVDLIVLNHNMPGLSGAEALPRIYAHRPEVRVLLSSGFVDTDLKLLLAFPSVRVLQIPYSLAELEAALRLVVLQNLTEG